MKRCGITIIGVFTPYTSDEEVELEKIPGAFGKYGTDDREQVDVALSLLQRSSERTLTAHVVEY